MRDINGIYEMKNDGWMDTHNNNNNNIKKNQIKLAYTCHDSYGS